MSAARGVDLDQTFPTTDGEPAGPCIRCGTMTARTTQHGNPACDSWPNCWAALPDVDSTRPDDDIAAWHYPGVNAIGGQAHVRAWAIPGGGRLVVVTELGVGCSVTNAAHLIHERLTNLHDAEVIMLEHCPSEMRGGEGPTLDQVTAVDGHPRWRRIWPASPLNIDYAGFRSWIGTGGGPVLDALGWDGPR